MSDAAALPGHPRLATSPLVVLALCADWCGTCRDFRQMLDRLARARPEIVFAWADIEDDAELVGDIDVESFPTLAVFRAGQALHLVQIFEVGTASMLAAGRAVRQTWELIKETGAAIDPADYVPAIRGYYSLADGRLASMPFNSSTAVMWYNKDAFEKAGGKVDVIQVVPASEKAAAKKGVKYRERKADKEAKQAAAAKK